MEYALNFPRGTYETFVLLAYQLGVKAITDSPTLRTPIVELLLRGHQHWESVSHTLGSAVGSGHPGHQAKAHPLQIAITEQRVADKIRGNLSYNLQKKI